MSPLTTGVLVLAAGRFGFSRPFLLGEADQKVAKLWSQNLLARWEQDYTSLVKDLRRHNFAARCH
ncbi:hypothetical protein N185_15600 [Sinorhizobium sp. GW3]|nr:hypothetical protein N185_15600 [Sinorhizobium sp. GW3]